MDRPLHTILVTGASGIVGRNFLETIKDRFTIYAVARRSQQEAGIPIHPNIKWIQADIAIADTFKSSVISTIKEQKHLDYVLHLASYYDYTYTPHSEYERTNITGTRHVLELAEQLAVKRFVFVSSVAACDFLHNNNHITEKTPVDAAHPYAVSKRKGEALTKEFSQHFPCFIVRPAAVFTDWCEYGVLYMFFNSWLSKKWLSRIIAGQGESAIPYIHTHDLNHFFITLFNLSQQLPNCDVYIAAPNGSTCHRELFEAALEFFKGKKRTPWFFPRLVLWPAVLLRYFFGAIIGKPPFERPWMLKYTDKKLQIDASYTHHQLNWQPTPRFHILRRMLYLIERMKSQPEEWHFMNVKAMKRVPVRPNLLVYNLMVKRKDHFTDTIRKTLLNPANKDQFPQYQNAKPINLKWDINVFYQLLAASIRNKDRLLVTNYTRDVLAPIRYSEGFTINEIRAAILDTGEILISHLMEEPELKEMQHLIHDYITLTIQLTVDELENAFDQLIQKEPESIPHRNDIQEKLQHLINFNPASKKRQIPNDED
jgi:nucleoside-diphosphate-sugar epimerase